MDFSLKLKQNMKLILTQDIPEDQPVISTMMKIAWLIYISEQRSKEVP